MRTPAFLDLANEELLSSSLKIQKKKGRWVGIRRGENCLREKTRPLTNNIDRLLACKPHFAEKLDFLYHIFRSASILGTSSKNENVLGQIILPSTSGFP